MIDLDFEAFSIILSEGLNKTIEVWDLQRWNSLVRMKCQGQLVTGLNPEDPVFMDEIQSKQAKWHITGRFEKDPFYTLSYPLQITSDWIETKFSLVNRAERFNNDKSKEKKPQKFSL